MVTDPISDMLVRIKNALAVKKREVVLPYSNFKSNLATLLEKQGWLDKIEVVEGERGRKELHLGLKYDQSGLPTISGFKRISKPGQRIYSGSRELPRVRVGFGITVVSTSRGLMTDKEARMAKVGGEVVCQIW